MILDFAGCRCVRRVERGDKWFGIYVGGKVGFGVSEKWEIRWVVFLRIEVCGVKTLQYCIWKWKTVQYFSINQVLLSLKIVIK